MGGGCPPVAVAGSGRGGFAVVGRHHGDDDRNLERPGAGAWRREARALTALAVPIVLTNVGQVAIQTTDVVMIGWLGPEALAASVLGVNVMFVVLLFSIGVVAATAPMIAQDLGRRRQAVREPRRTVRQGLWVGLALSLPASLVLWHIAPLLHLLRQDPELIAGAESYVRAPCGASGRRSGSSCCATSSLRWSGRGRRW